MNETLPAAGSFARSGPASSRQAAAKVPIKNLAHSARIEPPFYLSINPDFTRTSYHMNQEAT
jgi:hypothetical protein